MIALGKDEALLSALVDCEIAVRGSLDSDSVLIRRLFDKVSAPVNRPVSV